MVLVDVSCGRILERNAAKSVEHTGSVFHVLCIHVAGMVGFSASIGRFGALGYMLYVLCD